VRVKFVGVAWFYSKEMREMARKSLELKQLSGLIQNNITNAMKQLKMTSSTVQMKTVQLIFEDDNVKVLIKN
jgi:hypothetical protein